MDKTTRPGNPLLYPADEVLMAAIQLEQDPAFKILSSWISACYGATVNRMPGTRDEIDLRWMQGQCQALLLVNKAFAQPRQELQNREAKAKENALSRNV